jgi:hypothetical protein
VKRVALPPPSIYALPGGMAVHNKAQINALELVRLAIVVRLGQRKQAKSLPPSPHVVETTNFALKVQEQPQNLCSRDTILWEEQHRHVPGSKYAERDITVSMG